MGYYSEVAYMIVFQNSDDLNGLLSKIPEDSKQIVRDGATIKTDRIIFHDESMRWYLTREFREYLNPKIHLEGDPRADAHDALLQVAQEEVAKYQLSEGKEGIFSVGAFLRFGEEDDDLEQYWWGDDDRCRPWGLPEPWELIQYRRTIIIEEEA